MELLTQRYAPQIAGVLASFDRIIITGTLPDICYAGAITRHLRQHDIRCFDYAKSFAEPLRDELRAHVEAVAHDAGLTIEFIRCRHDFRKESRVQEILQERGDHPGLVHVFSAMERCAAFQPWHDKQTQQTAMRYTDGKCLHYYFYFIDPEFGLCYLRVPTWAPFRLQFYCNGHNWLARQLAAEGIACQQLDNTFVAIADWARAQALADAFPVRRLHQMLDHAAAQYCPVLRHFSAGYHWSLMQLEYATDIVFTRQDDLRPLYESLVHTAIHAVKPASVATFLGRPLHPNFQQEVGNNFHTRIEGTRIKHQMGPVALKMYDKSALVLRLETTTNDVTFFKHYREVEHRHGPPTKQLAAVQKTIYSLGVLRELLGAANQRYLAFLSDLIDPSAGVRKVEQLAQPAHEEERSYRGFNLFARADLDLIVALARGEWHISGFQNRSLRACLGDKTGAQVSRLLKRLHTHGLIRKVGHTYKYYLTKFGQEVLLTALKLRELVVIPTLAGVAAA